MRDVYKGTMDTVKAPDELAEKTLKLMLEEHKKLGMKAEADAALKETNYPAASSRSIGTGSLHRTFPRPGCEPRRVLPQTRWITHGVLPVAACLCLFLSVIVPNLLHREATDAQNPPADLRYSTGTSLSSSPSPSPSASPRLETPAQGTSDAHGFTESDIKALAIDNLATRNGPSVEYRDTGTYPIKGESVRLVSRAYDEDGICWVQCEVLYANKLRRVYTSVKRFDTTSFDLGSVPAEEPQEGRVEVTATSKAMYGPGDGYDTYAALTLDMGQAVSIIGIEKDYAQVEWTTSKQSYRAWVPVQTLSNH